MKYDIVMVSYNSSRWIENCINALRGVDYDKKLLNIIFVDNASTDKTVEMLQKFQTQCSDFGGFSLIKNNVNSGFGKGCNIGAKNGTSPYIFFLNVDTEVDSQLFKNIDSYIKKASSTAGAFECRQLPYEMGHHVDPITLETPYVSGAAVVVIRSAFEKIAGFDENIFLYGEDKDLSIRLRGAGNQLFYMPNALVYHFVLSRENTEISECLEYTQTKLNQLLLEYKYNSFFGILAANKRYIQQLIHPQHFANVRKIMAKNYCLHFAKFFKFFKYRFSNRDIVKNCPRDLRSKLSYERGRYVLPQHIVEGPLVSVVVRTCSRPQSLRKTLQSLEHQTYKNFEIVVAEDGQDTSRSMIEKEFSHLPITYHATGERQGRGKNGNIGLSLAKGEYCNFLDDDDFFYPDHLELMVSKALQHPNADLVVGCAMVMKADVIDKQTHTLSVKELYPMYFERIDVFTMSQTCQIPIQSAMFKTSLYRQYGGLKEGIEANEDWAMWLKFIANGKRIDPYHADIARASSIFVLPADDNFAKERIEKYRPYNQDFYNDETISFNVTLKDMRIFYDNMIGDVMHAKNLEILDEFLERESKRE